MDDSSPVPVLDSRQAGYRFQHRLKYQPTKQTADLPLNVRSLMDEVALVCHRVPSLMDPTGDTGSRRVMIKLNGRITSCCPDHLTPGRLEKKKRKKNGQKFTSIFHRNHRRSNPPLPPSPSPAAGVNRRREASRIKASDLERTNTS